MRSSMSYALASVLSLVGITVAVSFVLSQDDSKRPVDDKSHKQKDKENHGNKPKADQFYAVEIKGGTHALVESTAALTFPAQRPSLRRVTFNQVELVADCETDPTPSSGIRRDCDSDPSVVTLPRGYYFVESQHSVSREIDRGTDNREYVEWHNRVEIYPGTGVFVPTTVRFWVHARGPSGPNSGTGRTKSRLVAPYRALPPTAK